MTSSLVITFAVPLVHACSAYRQLTWIPCNHTSIDMSCLSNCRVASSSSSACRSFRLVTVVPRFSSEEVVWWRSECSSARNSKSANARTNEFIPSGSINCQWIDSNILEWYLPFFKVHGACCNCSVNYPAFFVECACLISSGFVDDETWDPLEVLHPRHDPACNLGSTQSPGWRASPQICLLLLDLFIPLASGQAAYASEILPGATGHTRTSFYEPGVTIELSRIWKGTPTLEWRDGTLYKH